MCDLPERERFHRGRAQYELESVDNHSWLCKKIINRHIHHTVRATNPTYIKTTHSHNAAVVVARWSNDNYCSNICWHLCTHSIHLGCHCLSSESVWTCFRFVRKFHITFILHNQSWKVPRNDSDRCILIHISISQPFTELNWVTVSLCTSTVAREIDKLNGFGLRNPICFGLQV